MDCAGTNDAADTERSIPGGGSGRVVTAESSAPEILWEAEGRLWGICTKSCKTLAPEAIELRGLRFRNAKHGPWNNRMIREL